MNCNEGLKRSVWRPKRWIWTIRANIDYYHVARFTATGYLGIKELVWIGYSVWGKIPRKYLHLSMHRIFNDVLGKIIVRPFLFRP